MDNTPDVIQGLLARQNRSVRWLATTAGTPYKPLLRVLKGRQRITLEDAARVAVALGVELPDLIPAPVGEVA